MAIAVARNRTEYLCTPFGYLLAAACLTLLAPVRVDAAFSIRQSATGGDTTSPFSAHLGSAPLSNNLLVAICVTRNAGNMTGPGGWSTAIEEDNLTLSQGIYYKVAGASESQDVTCTSTASGSSTAITVYEWTGAATASPLDGTAGSAGGSSTSNVSSGTPSGLSYANDLLIVGIVHSTGTSLSGQTNSFTEHLDFIVGGGGGATLIGDYYRTHSGNNNSTAATTTQNGNYRGQIAAFKSSSPTAVTLMAFAGTRDPDGRVALKWHTGYEINNLGFHIYRVHGGTRTRLTPWPLAGSALSVGPRLALASGQSYGWRTVETADEADSTYELESIDLDGRRTWHGPIGLEPGARGENGAPSPVLGSGPVAAALASLAGPGADPPGGLAEVNPAADLDSQWQLADGAALKIFIETPGWYRLTQPALLAAGLARGVDPRTLRLMVNGREVPIRVTGQADGRFDPSDTVEFYGTGIDTPWSTRQVYWLVGGGGRIGRRIPLIKSGGAGGRAASQFGFPVERHDRVLFFAALQNGNAENWFGPIVSATQPTTMGLTTVGFDPNAAKAVVEVWIQGVSTSPDTPEEHRVGVMLNGVDIGEVQFDGQANATRRFYVDAALVIEGVNEITFETRGGPLDVSLVDRVRLTYARQYRFDGDALWCKATGRTLLTMTGAADPAVRVVDVTDPANVVEVRPRSASRTTAGYNVTVAVPGSGRRQLLAFTGAAIRTPAAVERNRPSEWHLTRADYLIVAHPTLLGAMAPLAAHRTSRGYTVATIDVTDVYDEFSYGRKTPQAIADFLRTTARRTTRYVLLAGDASSDPRDYAGFGEWDLVPTFFRPMRTVQLEAASDEALGDTTNDGLADGVLLGRLPARTPEQAESMVAKILAFEQAPPNPDVLLVTDANDSEYDFEGMSDSLEALMPGAWHVTKAYAGQMGNAGAHAEIVARLNDAPWLVNYAGHGSTGVWGQSGTLFTASDADGLTGTAGIVIAMNCLNGFFTSVFPPEAGLAEALVRSPNGAVAVWASSSLTTAPGQLAAARRLYTRLAAGADLTLGAALRAAKSASTDRDVRESWILFGDPALVVK
jgi:hypothetical protein